MEDWNECEFCVNTTILKHGYEDTRKVLNSLYPKIRSHFDRFGVIFHWGIYSIFAYNPPRSKKTGGLYNGSEWYWSRYKKPFVYTSKTKDYHKENYGDRNYYEFIKEFEDNANDVDFEKWATILKSKGVEYVIITSKHHDGVSMYPSNYGMYKTKKDYIGNLARAVRKKGMKFGVYYSLMEITMSYGNGRSAKKVKEYVDTVMLPQLKELVEKYKVSFIWSDGDWQQSPETWRSYEFLDWLFEKSNVKDFVIVNDRWGKNFKPKPTYRIRYNHTDRYIPSKDSHIEQWEHINTISSSWGFASNQTSSDYKDPKELEKLKERVLDQAGYFLINFGPDSHGNLDPKEVDIFNKSFANV